MEKTHEEWISHAARWATSLEQSGVTLERLWGGLSVESRAKSREEFNRDIENFRQDVAKMVPEEQKSFEKQYQKLLEIQERLSKLE